MRFCIILGAMKAGTTSLFHYLSQHPEISPCKVKEPSFFSHHYDKGLEYYLNLWPAEDLKTKVLLEASVNYTKGFAFPQSSQNLLDFSQKYDASIKYIYIMRNPFDRLESQYTYSYALWTDETLQQRLEAGHLINVSRYAHQLDQYDGKFSRDDILLLDFDDLKYTPDKVLRRICEHLHIDPGYRFSGLVNVHNKSKGRVITRPVERIYRKYPVIKSLSNLFPKKLKQYISWLVFRKRITRKFKLSEEQRRYVYGHLKDDMFRLRDKYGVDINKWGF